MAPSTGRPARACWPSVGRSAAPAPARGGGGGPAGGAEPLASASRRSLEIAEEAGLETVAFPSISTGIYGFPRERAARISQRTVRAWLLDHEAPRRVTLCVFSPADLELPVSIARGEGGAPAGRRGGA